MLHWKYFRKLGLKFKNKQDDNGENRNAEVLYD